MLRSLLWLPFLALVLLAGAALADRVLVLDSGKVTVTRVVAIPEPDGGWLVEVCAEVKQADGGTARAPEAECVSCSPGPWASIPAVCKATWKTAQGL